MTAIAAAAVVVVCSAQCSTVRFCQATATASEKKAKQRKSRNEKKKREKNPAAKSNGSSHHKQTAVANAKMVQCYIYLLNFVPLTEPTINDKEKTHIIYSSASSDRWSRHQNERRFSAHSQMIFWSNIVVRIAREGGNIFHSRKKGMAPIQ